MNKKIRKNRVSFLILIVTLLSFFTPLAYVKATDKIKLGDISASTNGLSSVQAISQLAISDINQYMIENDYPYRFEAVVRDAVGDANYHLEVVQSLKNLGVNLVIGGRWSSQAQVSVEYMNQNNMLLLSPSSTSHLLAIPGDNLFRTCGIDPLEGAVLAEMLWSHGVKAIVVIQRGDWWADGIYDKLKLEFEKRGGVVLTRILYPTTATDYSSYLASAEDTLSAAKTTYDISSLAVELISFDEGANIVAQAEDYSTIYSVPWFGCGGNTRISKFIEVALTQAAKLHIYGLEAAPMASDTYISLSNRYETMTGQPFNYYSACAYDAYWLYALSVIDAGSADAMDVKSALPSVAEYYVGASGWCRFNEDGDRYSQNYDIWGYERVGASVQPVQFGYYSSFTGQVHWKTLTQKTSTISSYPGSVDIIKGGFTTVTGTLNPSLFGVPVKLYYLQPDGSQMIRTATTDAQGSFTDVYTPQALGQWMVQSVWEGNTQYFGSESTLLTFTVKLGGFARARVVPKAGPEELEATLTGGMYDQGVDEDGDSTYDFLEIGVEINVTKSAYYGIELKGLVSSDSTFMDIRPEILLEPREVGLQFVSTRISGQWIYSYGLNPVNVSSITLLGRYKPLEEITNAPLSRGYEYREFDVPGASLTGVIYDQGIDFDEDGKFDVLEIGVEVNVTDEAQSNGYTVSIYGGGNSAFGFSGSGKAWEPGVYLVSVNLDGKLIHTLNTDLVSLPSVSLLSENGDTIWVYYDVPLSREYLYTEFDPPGAILTGRIIDRGGDTDDDGTFDELEVGVEVNVTEADYYTIISRVENCVWQEGFNSSFLDIGVHTVTTSIDGNVIHISGKDPLKVTLQLWLGRGGYQELREIPLSRKYLFTEFDEPQVAIGDWAKYHVNATWYSTDPDAIEPNQVTEQKQVKWLKIEVKNVTYAITLLPTYCYQNGTETTREPISGNVKHQFLTYIIPDNLNTGGRVRGDYFSFNPVVEQEGIYAGRRRSLIYTNFTMSFFGMNITTDMYWDRSTGILCEMNNTILWQVDDHVTRQSTSTKIIETNLWNAVTGGIKIVDCGALSSSVDVNNPVVVWYKAVYEHDGEEFNGDKGSLIVNDVTMTWSSTNQRWEMEITSSEPKTVIYEVTGVQDNIYGLTAFIDTPTQPSVEWKQAGITGYPVETVLCGILLAAAVIWIIKGHKMTQGARLIAEF